MADILRLLKKISYALKWRIRVVFNRGGSYGRIALSNTWIGDGFATTHDVGFLRNEKFIAAFEGSLESISDKKVISTCKEIIWRAYICSWGAKQALALGGDFIELGVWHGVISKTVVDFVDFSKEDARLYLVDSWGAMPGGHKSESYAEDIFEEVSSKFLVYPNVELIRGVVPEVLPKIPTKCVAYLAIDMNGWEAELASLEHFYPLMKSGGFIYFDDYGYGYPKLREVVNDFFEDKPETILILPTGQAVVIKI
jgi:O-methyltransferase